MYNFRFDILIFYFEMELGSKMVFSFGFRFGNKWLDHGTSSQSVCIGVGIDGLLLMSHEFRVFNNPCKLALPVPTLSFVIV